MSMNIKNCVASTYIDFYEEVKTLHKILSHMSKESIKKELIYKYEQYGNILKASSEVYKNNEIKSNIKPKKVDILAELEKSLTNSISFADSSTLLQICSSVKAHPKFKNEDEEWIYDLCVAMFKKGIPLSNIEDTILYKDANNYILEAYSEGKVIQ